MEEDRRETCDRSHRVARPAADVEAGAHVLQRERPEHILGALAQQVGLDLEAPRLAGIARELIVIAGSHGATL